MLSIVDEIGATPEEEILTANELLPADLFSPWSKPMFDFFFQLPHFKWLVALAVKVVD